MTTSAFQEQINAADALLRFLNEHQCHVPGGISASRGAFERGDVEEACRLAYGVKAFGMGSLTDDCPTPREGEDLTYCCVVLESLVRNWCFWVSVADDANNSYGRRVLRAIGSFIK